MIRNRAESIEEGITNNHAAQESIQEILGKTIFSGLETQTLRALSRSAFRKKLVAGQCLYVEGDQCIGLYLVGTGKLKGVKASPNGREQVIRLIGPGELLNEIGAFVDSLNPLTVVAIAPSTVWIFERQIILHLAKIHPQIYRVVVENLSFLVLQLFDLIEDLSFRNVEGRLARLLLETLEGGKVRRPFWSTQAELATYVGTTPVVMNRVLNELVTEGVIHFNRKQIDILNLQGLRNKAMESYK